ncbi:MAG: FmdB family transcriptional regulator [Desulfobacterales bacterium RIFOXYA12_FULL_46_15]|nr:MAG: FmdB family transcriptional regulator [Desulfobacula sp. GWF2_41_7]OGR28171.1 MAG: FmdB family transcriptional regulator [Desulfobacterales bacterium RIFOXYA12_FULL_46_15]
MPIYEFKCLKCEEFFEVILIGSKDDGIKGCPKCGSEEFERVVSRTNFTMGGSGQGQKPGVQTQERTCSGGSCKTYTVPGETR